MSKRRESCENPCSPAIAEAKGYKCAPSQTGGGSLTRARGSLIPPRGRMPDVPGATQGGDCLPRPRTTNALSRPAPAARHVALKPVCSQRKAQHTASLFIYLIHTACSRSMEGGHNKLKSTMHQTCEQNKHHKLFQSAMVCGKRKRSI